MPEDRFGGRSRTSTANPAQPPRRQGAPSPVSIHVPKLVPAEKPGNVKGFASVVFGEGAAAWRVNGWRIVQEPGRAPWVGPPVQERQRRDSKTGEIRAHFFPVVELPESWHKAASAAVLAAWERFEKDGTLPSVPIGNGAAAKPKGGRAR